MDARPNRRSIRLRGYNYSRVGAYFVSICTKERKCLFGDIENQKMSRNDAGRMVDKWSVELENKFKEKVLIVDIFSGSDVSLNSVVAQWATSYKFLVAQKNFQ